jgi:NAD(P)-dependent dehydrogenase (short-subunit alcohol dehydrogenase family)
MSTSPQKKIALVTGTSSGIGLSTVVQLAQHGFTVIATMRDIEKGGPLQARAREVGVEIELQAIYGPMVEAYMGGSQERFAAMGQTPDQVAQVIVAAATTEAPDFRYTTSPMMQGFAAQKYVDTTGNGLVAYFEKQLGKE